MNVHQNNEERLREIAKSTKVVGIDLVPLITEAYSLLQPFLKPVELETVYHDIHGFDLETGIDYYQKPPVHANESGYIPYLGMAHRERHGQLIVIKPDGTQEPLHHDLASREEFIITAPLAELQRLSRMQTDTVLVEMPELTQMIGERVGGKIGLLTQKSHIDQIVENTAQGLRGFIDLAITPGRREQLDRLQAEMTANQKARAKES